MLMFRIDRRIQEEFDMIIYSSRSEVNKFVVPRELSRGTKWNGDKPHTQIETPPKFRPAVHPPPSFARFCETRISSSMLFSVKAI